MKVESKTYGEPCCPPVEGTITELELEHAECQALLTIPNLDRLTAWFCQGPGCPSNPVFFKSIWDAKQKIVDADKGNGCKVTFNDCFLPEPTYELTVHSL